MDVKNSIISKPTLPQTVDTPQLSLLKSHKQSIIDTLDPCNKKRRVTKNGLQEECNLVSRQWENLDSNILRIIYSRVPVQDLFLNVSSVCLSWEAACWDYMFWSRNVVDLSATGAGLGVYDMSDVVSLVKFKSKSVPGIFTASDPSEKYNGMATSLMRKLCRIFEGQSIQGWTDSIQTVILPYDLEISDTHLLYIAERTPRLQHLILLCPCKITAGGFTRAIQNWKHLKEIDIGSLENYAFIHFLEEMGRNCKELEILHIHQEDFKVDGAIATVVAKSLPGLKKMEFELGDMRPTGVVSLFEMCLKLEEMRFSCCALKHDYDFPAEFPKLSIFERQCDFNLLWIDTGEADGEWKVEPGIASLEEYKEMVERLKFDFTGEELYHFAMSEENKAYSLSRFEEWLTDSRSWSLLERPCTFSAQRQKQIIEKYSKKFEDRIRSRGRR